jgi:hypothetical protein
VRSLQKVLILWVGLREVVIRIFGGVGFVKGLLAPLVKVMGCGVLKFC